LKKGEFGALSTEYSQAYAITPNNLNRVQNFKRESPLDRKDLQRSAGNESKSSQKGVDFHFSQYRMLELQSAGLTHTVFSGDGDKDFCDQGQNVKYNSSHVNHKTTNA